MKPLWRLPSLILFLVSALTISATGAAANTSQSTDIDPIAAINSVAPQVFQNRAQPATVARAGALITTSTGISAQVPQRASQGITLTSHDKSLTIGLPEADRSVTRHSQDGSAYFRNSAASSIVPVVKDDGSLQLISVSETAGSPNLFSYSLQLPDGTEILHAPDGGYAFQDVDGNLSGLITAPWAVDSKGKSVPTSYTLVGNTLTQQIDFSAPNIVFPIVADPTIYYFWWGYGVKYTKSQTAQVANAANSNVYYAFLCGVLPYAIAALCSATAFVMYGQYFNAFTTAKNQGKCVQVNYPFGGVPVPAWAYVVNC